MKIEILGKLKTKAEDEYIEIQTLEELQQYIDNKYCHIYTLKGMLCLYAE